MNKTKRYELYSENRYGKREMIGSFDSMKEVNIQVQKCDEELGVYIDLSFEEMETRTPPLVGEGDNIILIDKETNLEYAETCGWETIGKHK